MTAPRPKQPVGEWLPIESAPKDGSEILIWKPSSTVCIAHWEVDPQWHWDGEWPCWAVFMADDDFYSIYLDADWPTHWMPLPEPPK